MVQNGNGSSGDGATEGLPSGLTGEVRALIEMMSRGGIAELSLQTAAVNSAMLHFRRPNAQVGKGSWAASCKRQQGTFWFKVP